MKAATRARWQRTLAGLGVTALLLVLLLGVRPALIQGFEAALYDLRLRHNLLNQPDPRIVIIDIDEPSLAQLGRWPWSRETMAQLLDQAFQHYDVSLLAFDILFSEPDTRVELARVKAVLDERLANDQADPGQIIAALDPDRQFAEALQGRPVVMGYLFAQHENSQRIGTPGSALQLSHADLGDLEIVTATGVISSLTPLRSDALLGGFFDNPLVDPDGVFRRVPLIQRYQGQYYPALSLAILLELFGETQITPLIEQDSTGQFSGLVALDVGGLQIPVDNQAAMLVPYRGGPGSFTYVSAVDLLNGTAPPDKLAGAIALVGTSAAGLLDLRVTPVASRLTGVEVHANLLSAMLDERFLHRPDYTAGVELLQLLLTGLLLSVLIPFTRAVSSALLTLGWLALVTAFNLYAWAELSWVIPLGNTLILALVLFLVLQLYGYFSETRRTQLLNAQFGQYVPPEVVRSLAESDGEISLAGESRELTIFFSDVRGFTSISEGLTPAQLTRLMNLYLSQMTGVIHDYRGTIDKYIGDAIMAFWGAPVTDADHAQHATEAALAMQQRIRQVNERLVAEGLPVVQAGMGLNSAQVNVGNMGSSFRMAYTAMGDGVNLASRLEGLTKFYHCPILVTAAVRDQVQGILFRSVDLVQVKGKQQAVEIFQPLAKLTEISENDQAAWQLYESALQAYRQRRWSDATARLREFMNRVPDDPVALIYLERIACLTATPQAPDWSPVYTHTEK